ncbi:MBG domain-containing protein [Ekhidna sp.]|uniref:MBG domain-containing protein n=1 Tax=Ekhidna sp. TaxID=2608089 RepID=UPI00329721FD
MKKLLLPLVFFASLISHGQVPATSQEHLFTSGDLTGITQTGTALTPETDRMNVSTDAISLNGDHLSRASVNSPYISVSFWIKTTTNDAVVRTIVDHTERTSSANNTSERGWYTYLEDGNISMGGNFYYAYYYGVAPNGEYRTFHSGYRFATSTTDVSDGEWHHVTATAEPTYSGGTSLKYDYKIYIDGVLEDTERAEVLVSPNTLSYTLTPSNSIAIGNNSNANLVDKYEDGFDDIRFYGRKLTANEIEELAKEGVCSFPRTINVTNVQETSASVDWISNDLPSSWEISYVESGGLPNNGTIISNISEKDYEVTGLSSNVTYDLYVRSICDGSATDWSAATSFTTSNIVYVDKDAIGTNDGSSWVNAYTDLSTAIFYASASDFIWVAEGTYLPNQNGRNAAFILTDDKLFGGFDGTETSRTQRDPVNNKTILSGDVQGNDSGIITDTETSRQDNLYHVVIFYGTTTNVVVDGFTIKGGNANGPINSNCGSTGFSQYYGTRGGAIYAQPTQINQTLTATFRNCTIEENSGTSVGAYTTFVPCGITGTTVDVDFESCVIRNNYSNQLTAFFFAGSSGYANFSKGSIVNSLFHDNVSNTGSSCLYLGTSTANGGNASGIDVDIFNSTFADNTGASGNVMTMIGASNSTIRNSIIYDNGSATPFVITGSGSTVSNSIVEGGQQSGTNSDPSFSDVSADDFTLTCASVAIDAGDASGLTLPTKDIAGNDRENGTIDMGAFEYNDPIYASITAIAKNLTVALDPTGNVVIAPEDVDDGSGSTCGTEISLSLDITSFSCTDIGPNTVTLTATEIIGGASANVTATVTVIDDSAPIVNTQDITVSLDANGNATITPSQINDGSSDNCTSLANLIMGLDQTAFDCGDIGPNQVNLTLEDENGNTASATATVNIIDAAAPTLIGQNITLTLDANGTVGLTAGQLNNGSYDNCTSAGNLILSTNTSSFSCADIGTNQVELTIADESGNQAFTMLQVTIEDNSAPTVLAQNIVVPLDASGEIVIDPQSLDNGSTDNCEINFSLDKSAFNCSNIGVNNVILTGTDNAGNQASVSATITIEDDIAPIVITQNLTVQLDAYGQASVNPGSMDNGSTDNCSGALIFSLSQTDFTCSDIGVNTEVLTVTDDYGNQSSAQVNITVEDVTQPIVVTQNISVQLDSNGEVQVAPLSLDNGSSDNCTGQSSLIFGLDQSNFDCNDLGENSVTLTVTDANGNSSTTNATITVIDVNNPVVSAQNVTIKLNQNNEATVYADDLDNGSFDNCGLTLSLERVFNNSSASRLVAPTGPSLTFTNADIGSNTVELSATDLSGNSTSVTVTVTVEPYKMDQTISFGTIADQVYGNADITLSADASSGLSVQYSIVTGTAVQLSGNVLSIVGSGEVTIEASQAGDDDYFEANSVQQIFTVSKAMLSVAAGNQTITYGENIPALTVSYSGFVNGENAENLDGEPSVTADFGGQVEAPNAGVYDLIVSGGSSDNYEFQLIDGILTIDKADQVISIDPISDKQPSDDPFSIIASVDSDLPLIYSVTGPATISEEIITLDGTEGTVTVSVEQIGDINYNAVLDTETFEVAVPLAAEDIEDEISVYPNPTSDFLNFTVPNVSSVRIFSLNGSVERSELNVRSKIDISDLSPGSYLIELIIDEKKVIRRILKAN